MWELSYHHCLVSEKLFSSLCYLNYWQVIYFNRVLQSEFCKCDYWKGTQKC